jgi:chloramphenicol-sensitive protein RarD
MNNQKHIAAAMSAFVIWGFFSIPLRAVEDFTAGEILYFRILFSLITLLMIILVFKRKDLQQDWKRLIALPREQKRATVLLTLAGGALLGVNWLTFIYIVNDINVKTASFSYLICPVITAILGYLLLQEKLNIIQWVSVGLCAISCLLIGLSSALELWYSVLTALTYALYLISQRKNQGFDRIVALGVQVIFCFIMLNFVRGYLVDRVPTSPHFYSVVMIIAVFFTIIPLFLNLFALNKINSATIGILMYINPLINFAIALIVFKEQISMIQGMGYSLIIVALILFNYPNVRKIQAAALIKRTQ